MENDTIHVRHEVKLWPRLMYHRTKGPVRVANEAEEMALGDEWSRTQFPEPQAEETLSLEKQVEMFSDAMRKRVLHIEDELSKVYERLARAEGQIADLMAAKKK